MGEPRRDPGLATDGLLLMVGAVAFAGAVLSLVPGRVWALLMVLAAAVLVVRQARRRP